MESGGSTTISSLASLRAAIASLPPVAPGCVRVWRGQTKDYAKMLPSGLRRSIRNRAIWHVYSQHLHLDMVPDSIAADGTVDAAELMAIGLWLHAVAQHYGPGSDFLDVAHSMEAALWFALNEYREVRAEGLIGPDGPPDPLRDHPTLSTMATYDAWHEPGFLYAFDFPVWDGETLPAAGVVIDIAKAPAVFADSPRMRAQHGCLVNCRQKGGEALDLRGLCVAGTPLRVQRPMSGARDIDRRVSDMFPSPDEDTWYSRLLSVPMNYAPEPAPPRLQRSIPVVPYFDERNAGYNESVIWRNVAVNLPLLHRGIPAFVQPEDPSQRPVIIVLESPMVFPYPPGNSGDWHHGLLAEDLPAQCSWYELQGGAPGGAVSLASVLFEFSALEHTGWERVIEKKYTMNAMRGVWLRRVEDYWAATFFPQTLPSGGLKEPETLTLRFDSRKSRWSFFIPNDASLVVPISDVPEYAKPLLVALMVLRHLNPKSKADAHPRMSAGAAGGKRKVFVNVAGDAARLYRVRSPVCDWFVARDTHMPEEPFTHVSKPAGLLELTVSSGSFADIPIDKLRVA